VTFVYIDTTIIRSLNFGKYISPLLYASKLSVITLYIHETVLWERARQYYEAEKGRLMVVGAPLSHSVAWFRQVFSEHGAIIVEPSDSCKDDIAKLFEDKNAYFKADNPNDIRDATIYVGALEVLDCEGTLVLCGDDNLAQSFRAAGYTVRKDADKFIDEITVNLAVPQMVLPSIQDLEYEQVTNALSKNTRVLLRTADSKFLEYERELPVLTDKLKAKLESMHLLDDALRKRVLGYIHWFAPVAKTELHELLKSHGYADDIIENTAKRLELEGLVTDTGAHWISNTKKQEINEICEQALAAVMPEILEKLGLA
jgi:hypothetical protein